MTSALDASLFLSGATPGDVFEVSRTVSLGASKPEYFRVPGILMDEALVVTHTGAGGFTATLQWEFDPNSASGLGGSPIDTVFRFAGAGTEPAAVFNVTPSGNVLSIPGLTDFSTFYAGNATAVPVTLSGFALDGPPGGAGRSLPPLCPAGVSPAPPPISFPKRIILTQSLLRGWSASPTCILRLSWLRETGSATSPRMGHFDPSGWAGSYESTGSWRFCPASRTSRTQKTHRTHKAGMGAVFSLWGFCCPPSFAPETA